MLIRFDVERIIHSVKTAIACMIGFLLAKMIGYPADQWIVITIIVVMCAQIYVGSVMQKAYLRFVGTLVGCLFATITIMAVGDTNIAIAVTIGLSSLIFSYLATGREDLTYACTLGAATTAIIMLGQTPTVALAGIRFLEISIGILIAALVSQFILPIHARTHLRRTQATTLEQLCDYYSACMITRKIEIETLRYEDLDENIIKSLSKQRQLAKEAIREPLGIFYDPKHFIKSLHCEKEILRAIDFMHSAFINIKNVDLIFSQSLALDSFNETIVQSLNTLITVVESDEPEKNHIHIPSIHVLKEEIQKNNLLIDPEDLIYIDGFLFSAEILTIFLTKLANLYGVPILAGH